MLRLRLVVGKVVPSLGSGGGNTLTRGLNEVRRKVNGGTLRNTYIHMGEKEPNEALFGFY